MAVDNRDFVDRFANEGGGDVLCEDARFGELKSATGKTASQISTTTDFIPLQDTDGNLVKINPESFQEAVRNVLGSLLANNDKGTTISGVPALSGSGASLDLGSVTPANLASVLGVGHLVHFNPQENIVIPKGNVQAILACSINGAIYQPSLFLLGRKSGIIAISEESGVSSNHISFNDNGDIVVTGYVTYHFYYRLWLME